MSNHYKLEFIDYLAVIIKKKRHLAVIFFFTLVISYGLIFFCVEKQYEASAVIIPNGQNPLAGVSSLVKNISNALPIGIGNISQESEMDLFNTIIFSRTSIENLIQKYDLQNLYKIKRKDVALKTFRKMIRTDVTMENAFVITVRTKSPQLASDITNYLVSYLNDKIIELNVSKSRDNRAFLEQRYLEIKDNVEKTEFTLKEYQDSVGILDASDQIKYTLGAFAKLESELSVKQVEYSVFTKIYGENSSNAAAARISINEYKNKLEKLKKGKEKNSTIIGLDSLPQKALEYYRLYRDVKMNEEMLRFIIPLYEQSKFEEQKDIPILQIIDPAVPPDRKAFPPRVLYAGFMASITLLFSISYLLVKEYLKHVNNPNVEFVKRELFRFK